MPSLPKHFGMAYLLPCDQVVAPRTPAYTASRNLDLDRATAAQAAKDDQTDRSEPQNGHQADDAEYYVAVPYHQNADRGEQEWQNEKAEQSQR